MDSTPTLSDRFSYECRGCGKLLSATLDDLDDEEFGFCGRCTRNHFRFGVPVDELCYYSPTCARFRYGLLARPDPFGEYWEQYGEFLSSAAGAADAGGR